LFTRKPASFTKDTAVLLITGIANAAPLRDYVHAQFQEVRELEYRDHHIFTIDDWSRIKAELSQLPGQDKIFLTTEKDAVRLIKFKSAIRQEPIYVLPVQMRFLFQTENIFLDRIRKYILENLHQS
jgi:tetraacyldisaccharide 4'-kinase